MAKISVIIPLYNPNTEQLKEAIDSILSQTFNDFEIFLIDDSSDNATKKLIQNYADSRIKHIISTERLGMSASLNLGIEMANGQYIARMDADDIAEPERLQKQFEFLEKNQAISILGSSLTTFGERIFQNIYPETNEEIKINLLFDSGFGHPCVMFRKNDFQKNNLSYSHNFNEGCEDVDLWTRAMYLYNIKGHNLKESLLKYRVHKNQYSTIRTSLKNESNLKIRINLLKYIGIDMNDEEIKIFERMLIGRFFNQLTKSLKLINNILLINKKKNVLDTILLKKTFINLANNTIKHCPKESIKLLPILHYLFCDIGKENSTKEKLNILQTYMKTKFF